MRAAKRAHLSLGQERFTPRAADDQRTQSTYLFGAVCPERGAGAASCCRPATAKPCTLDGFQERGVVVLGLVERDRESATSASGRPERGTSGGPGPDLPRGLFAPPSLTQVIPQPATMAVQPGANRHHDSYRYVCCGRNLLSALTCSYNKC